jgi:hypothetical protein
MALIRRPSRIAVLIACFAALVLWIAFDGNDRSTPAAGARVTASSETAASSVAGKPTLPARSALEKFVADPFSSHAWVPPRPKLAPVVNAAPVAPPLPYRFAGQLFLDSGMQVFLARGDEIIPVKQGDTVDGQYRVESVSTTSMALVHIATNTRQVMEFDPLKDPDIAAGSGNTASASSAVPAPASVASAPTTVKPAGAVGTPPDVPGKPGTQQPAQLRWDGPASAKAGASFNVALRVTSGEQIRSAPMMVRFDPAVLESVSVRPGRYFGAEASGNFGYRVNPDGSIFVGASSKKASPATDAELLVLTFKPIKPATSAEISVASLNLQGAAGHTIAYGSMTPFKTTITP